MLYKVDTLPNKGMFWVLVLSLLVFMGLKPWLCLVRNNSISKCAKNNWMRKLAGLSGSKKMEMAIGREGVEGFGQ